MRVNIQYAILVSFIDFSVKNSVVDLAMAVLKTTQLSTLLSKLLYDSVESSVLIANAAKRKYS